MEKKTLMSLLLGAVVIVGAVVAILNLGPLSNVVLPFVGSVPMFVPIALGAIALLVCVVILCQKIFSSDPFSDFSFIQAPQMSVAAVNKIPEGNMLFSGLVATQSKGYSGEAPSNRFAMKLAYEIYAHRNPHDPDNPHGAEKRFYEERLFTQEHEGLKSEVNALILGQAYPQGLSFDDLKGIVSKCHLIPIFYVERMSSSKDDRFIFTRFQKAPQACLDHMIGQIEQREQADQKAPQVVPAALIGNFSAQPVPVAEAVSGAGPQYSRSEYELRAADLLEGLSKPQEMQYTSGGGCLTTPDSRGLLVLTLLSAFEGVNVAKPKTWQQNKNHVVLIERLLNGTLRVDDRKNLPETINTYAKVIDFLQAHYVDYTIVDSCRFVFSLAGGATPRRIPQDSQSLIQQSFGEVPEVRGTPLQSVENAGSDASNP